MNFKKDLSTKNQILLKQAGGIVEDRNYTTEEIKQNLDKIASHIMSKSSKNGDLNKEIVNYNDLINTLVRNQA